MLFLVAFICTVMPCLLVWMCLQVGWEQKTSSRKNSLGNTKKKSNVKKKKHLLDINEIVNNVLMDGVRGIKLTPQVKFVIYENRRVTDFFLNVPLWHQTRQCALRTMINWREKTTTSSRTVLAEKHILTWHILIILNYQVTNSPMDLDQPTWSVWYVHANQPHCIFN